MENVQCKTQIL